jgi:uncharacterized protein
MGERTSYPPGTFSWADLATTDADGAKAFYSELFGWKTEDNPVGESGTYTMCRLDGKDVAALSEQREDERSQGIPPHWNSYVTVDDLERRAASVEGLGGKLLVPPFDVMEVGRMAVAADPDGAVFSMWQPKSHIGAGLVNVPGSFTWNELATRDVGKAKEFYTGLFGWATEEFDGGAYTVIRNGEATNGGIRPLGEQEGAVPPHWLVYFAASDCDETTSNAGELGGKALVPPMDVPIASGESRIAVIADPQGAAFGLFAGPLDP